MIVKKTKAPEDTVNGIIMLYSKFGVRASCIVHECNVMYLN